MCIRDSKYTKDFSNRVMFSSDAAYEKGWVWAVRTLEEEPQIIGFSCVRHKVREPVTMLYFIGVHEDYRGSGVGEALLEHIMRTGPHSRMELNVMRANERAVKFYRRLGFWIVGPALLDQAHRMRKDWA